jgi:nucleotide-binding universal stress UspA family protein
MKKIKDLDQECDYFSSSTIDKIAWIELKGNMLQQPTFQSIGVNSGQEYKMRILVGYDGSNAAKDALKLAKDRAKAFDAHVHVVTSRFRAKNNQYNDFRQTELGLEYAKALLEENNIDCETHLLIRGLSPGEDLVLFAEDNQIDEIIVGVRRRSKVGKLLMGSTAQHVVLNSFCPVVTIK